MSPELVLLPSPPGSDAYLAVDKPAGRVVHGAAGVLGELRASIGAGLELVHRLDRLTSGVLLLARTKEALRAAHRAWPAQVTKVYWARTRGVPTPREGTIALPLLEHRTGRPDLLRRALRAACGPERAGALLAGEADPLLPAIPPPGTSAVHPAGREARTDYRVLREDRETALVELRPFQGRLHQIRVHLAAIGAPVLGDPLYDPLSAAAGVPLLHARALTWESPPGMPAGTVWTWESPLPTGFGHER